MRPLERGPRPARIRPTAAAAVLRELGLMFAAILAYFAIRGVSEGSVDAARDNAERLLELEQRLGIDWEATVQGWILGSHALTTLANWVYIWGHWPFIALVAVWLVRWHPAEYRAIRNAFLVSGSIGLVIFAAFPVAPPRLFDPEVVDTVTKYSRAYRVLQPPALVNQYAAMPSFHFGWNLLIGLGIIRCSRHPGWRVLGAVAPLAMGLATVATANHYVLDLAAGAAIALAAMYAVELARGRRAAPWQPALWLRPFEPGTVNVR